MNNADEFLSQEGAFHDGDLVIDRKGLRIVSQDGNETPLVENPLNLDDLNCIDENIGSGSQGTVQLMKYKETREFYAIKVITLNLEENGRKAIVKELKINQSLKSPYVVKCYQSFYDNGEILILLEYMDRGTLANLLGKVERIPEKYLAAICKQLLQGLSYLHHHPEKHIIHRDLKPSNLLINQKGEIKISDFGVSAETERTYAEASTYVGTKIYMAPERISGVNRYDHKSDIWSLGLVLLECATGQFPYSLSNQGEGFIFDDFLFLETVVKKPPPFAPSDQFTPNFCSFISSCLEKDPKIRMSARKLMECPFLTMYDNEQIDLSSYFKQAGSSVPTS